MQRMTWWRAHTSCSSSTLPWLMRYGATSLHTFAEVHGKQCCSHSMLLPHEQLCQGLPTVTSAAEHLQLAAPRSAPNVCCRAAALPKFVSSITLLRRTAGLFVLSVFEVMHCVGVACDGGGGGLTLSFDVMFPQRWLLHVRCL